jgi:chaperonin GroES
MKLNPLSNRVVIKFVEAEEKTKGGIVLTAAAQEKPQIAEVMAIGPGKVTDNGALAPMTVKVGDKVIASKYAGTAVKLDGTEYTILSEDDILAVVD